MIGSWCRHRGWTLLLMLADAALFGILLLLAFVVTHQAGQWLPWPWPVPGLGISLSRYDFLLLLALLIQAWLLASGRETAREALIIAVFHLVAMLMELFLTSPAIGSWHYPEAGTFRINNVPLFAGFMYSAVGSFIARGLRGLAVEWQAMPRLAAVAVLAVLAYANFFTHHFIMDFRWPLMLASVLLFWRTRLSIRLPASAHLPAVRYGIALLPVLLAMAVLVWIAENIATFSHIWLYPSQRDGWHWVGLGKIGSWYLLLLLSLTLVLIVNRSAHASQRTDSIN